MYNTLGWTSNPTATSSTTELAQLYAVTSGKMAVDTLGVRISYTKDTAAVYDILCYRYE